MNVKLYKDGPYSLGPMVLLSNLSELQKGMRIVYIDDLQNRHRGVVSDVRPGDEKNNRIFDIILNIGGRKTRITLLQLSENINATVINTSVDLSDAENNIYTTTESWEHTNSLFHRFLLAVKLHSDNLFSDIHETYALCAQSEVCLCCDDADAFLRSFLHRLKSINVRIPIYTGGQYLHRENVGCFIINSPKMSTGLTDGISYIGKSSFVHFVWDVNSNVWCMNYS